MMMKINELKDAVIEIAHSIYSINRKETAKIFDSGIETLQDGFYKIFDMVNIATEAKATDTHHTFRLSNFDVLRAFEDKSETQEQQLAAFVIGGAITQLLIGEESVEKLAQAQRSRSETQNFEIETRSATEFMTELMTIALKRKLKEILTN